MNPIQAPATLARPALLALTVAALGCGTEVTEPEVTLEVIEEVVFDASLGIDLGAMTRTPAGVYLQDLVEGTGAELAWGDRAEVAYVGWLRTGVEFSSGRFAFRMGNAEVIPGLEQGMLGMRVGGTRRVIIPPILAYGAAGSGPIPPGAILIFEVELEALTPPPGLLSG